MEFFESPLIHEVAEYHRLPHSVAEQLVEHFGMCPNPDCDIAAMVAARAKVVAPQALGVSIDQLFKAAQNSIDIANKQLRSMQDNGEEVSPQKVIELMVGAVEATEAEIRVVGRRDGWDSQ